MSTVLMLSGGGDSAALLGLLLNNTDEDIIALHLDFSAPGSREMNPNRRRHNTKSQAQETVIDAIVRYYQGVRPFTYETAKVALPPSYAQYPRRWYTVLGATALVEHKAKLLATGDTKLGSKDKNTAFCSEHYENILQSILSLGCGEATHTGKMLRYRYTHVPHEAAWVTPLVDLGLSKKQIIQSLPAEIRPLVVSCDAPAVHDFGWNRCKTCWQCKRFERLANA